MLTRSAAASRRAPPPPSSSRQDGDLTACRWERCQWMRCASVSGLGQGGGPSSVVAARPRSTGQGQQPVKGQISPTTLKSSEPGPGLGQRSTAASPSSGARSAARPESSRRWSRVPASIGEMSRLPGQPSHTPPGPGPVLTPSAARRSSATTSKPGHHLQHEPRPSGRFRERMQVGSGLDVPRRCPLPRHRLFCAVGQNYSRHLGPDSVRRPPPAAAAERAWPAGSLSARQPVRSATCPAGARYVDSPRGVQVETASEAHAEGERDMARSGSSSGSSLQADDRARRVVAADQRRRPPASGRR